jgi:hypothetical protein
MAKAIDKIQQGILGDINPRPTRPASERRTDEDMIRDRMESDEAMEGGSQHDDSQHTSSHR